MADASDALGRHLEGRYRIERPLGHGGMATVFLATDLKHGREVAIKTLDPDLAAAIGPERFRHEIEIAARLHHPHIVPLFDSGDVGGVLYYVMPRVAGESLRARLRREPQLPLDEALRLTREVAEALGHAHSQGVVHRDVKPENILIQGGHALLSDFGIARAPAAGGSLTATGVTLGTPAYMSPEQATGSRELDARSDVYSLACVLYEMLAGQPPFTGATAEILIRQHLVAEPPDVVLLRPGVPARVASAIRHALAKSSADRTPSAARLIGELEGAESTTTAPTVPVSPARARRGGGRWRVAAASLAGAALIAGLAWWVGRRAIHLPPPAPIHRRTEIAVLPFQNLSPDPAHAYFAGGLQDELLTQLSKVAGLRVISRTSAMSYQGSSKPLGVIADELGVGSVVEGSVQVVGDRLRVTVRLVDAAHDKEIWGRDFDRRLDDAFAIQSEVARRIVDAVGAALSESEQGRLAASPTRNAAAYRLYLQGLEYTHRPGLTHENIEAAAQLFESAIHLDPRFALARAQLSLTHGLIYWLRYDQASTWPAHMARQRSEAEIALRLEPDLPQAHLAMGLVHEFAERNFDAALRELEIARQGLPNDVDLWIWTAAIQRRRGHLDASLEAFRRAALLDPRNADNFFDLGGRTYLMARRYEEAAAALNTALALAPDLHAAAIEKGRCYVLWQGRLDSLEAIQSRIPEGADLGPYGSVAGLEAEAFRLERRSDRVLGMREVERGDLFDSARSYRPASLYSAWAELLRGDSTRARAWFEVARVRLDSAEIAIPGDWRIHASRGLALASLGRRGEARREAEWLRGSAVYRHDAMDGPDYAEARAQILAAVGDQGPALAELERLLSRPAFFSVQTLRTDPLWDALRDHPQFQALVTKFGNASVR